VLACQSVSSCPSGLISIPVIATRGSCPVRCPVHGPPLIGRPYNWARRSPGEGIPSRVRPLLLSRS